MKQHYSVLCGLVVVGFSAFSMQHVKVDEVDEKQAVALAIESQSSDAALPCAQLLEHNKILQNFLSEYSCQGEYEYDYSKIGPVFTTVMVQNYHGQENVTFSLSYDVNSKRVYMHSRDGKLMYGSEFNQQVVAVSPDKSYTVLFGTKKTSIYDADTKRCFCDLWHKNYQHILAVTWFAEGDKLATLEETGIVRVWDMRPLKSSLTKKQVALLEKLIQAKSLKCASDEAELYASLPDCWKKALGRLCKGFLASLWNTLTAPSTYHR